MTRAFAVWITGLPASGKSTIARALARELTARGVNVAVLESHVVRQVLTPNPTYSEQERETFYRSMTYIGWLLTVHGVPLIIDATANRRAYREEARTAIEQFVEVYVDCPLEVCAARDPKGIYRKAHSGEASSVPGVQVPYEAPEHPDVVVSGGGDAAAGARSIMDALEGRGFLRRHVTSLAA
jgi:adenylylsulfate kinase